MYVLCFFCVETKCVIFGFEFLVSIFNTLDIFLDYSNPFSFVFFLLQGSLISPGFLVSELRSWYTCYTTSFLSLPVTSRDK